MANGWCAGLCCLSNGVLRSICAERFSGLPLLPAPVFIRSGVPLLLDGGSARWLVAGSPVPPTAEEGPDPRSGSLVELVGGGETWEYIFYNLICCGEVNAYLS